MSPDFSFDASSVVRLRSSHCFTHDVSCDAFSLTLTTPALYRSSLGLFKASPCRAALEDLPPSLLELRHFINLLLFVQCLVAHILLKNSISGAYRISQEFFFTLVRNAEIECATLSAPRQDFHALPTTPSYLDYELMLRLQIKMRLFSKQSFSTE